MPAVGRRIRAAREDVGLTESALAERLGLSAATVYLWESEILDPGKRLQEIADATGKQLAWFGTELTPDGHVPLVEPPEPSIELALQEPEAARPDVAASEPEEESESLEPVAADEERLGEQERALAKWEQALVRAADEREQGLASRAAELEAQAARLDEQWAALAHERERLQGLEGDVGERARGFEQETAEHARRLAALAAAQERLGEQERALGEREVEFARAADEREQGLASRAAELEAQAARLDEQWAALAHERERLQHLLQKLLEAPMSEVRAEDGAEQYTVHASEQPAASHVSRSVTRWGARVDLSVFPSIASAYELGGRCIVVTLVDGRAVRVTAKHDPESGAFVSEYELAEPGSLTWTPSREYRACASHTPMELLVAALKEVGSGPQSREADVDSSAPSVSENLTGDEAAQPQVGTEASLGHPVREARLLGASSDQAHSLPYVRRPTWLARRLRHH